MLQTQHKFSSKVKGEGWLSLISALSLETRTAWVWSALRRRWAPWGILKRPFVYTDLEVSVGLK